MKKLFTIFVVALALGLGLMSSTVLAGGGGCKVEVQFVNNAADPTIPTLDIWVNGCLKADNLNFREATGFLSIWAGGGTLCIGVARSSSSSMGDSFEFYDLDVVKGERYIVLFSGVLRPNGFAKNPDGRKTTFNMFVKEGARVKQRNPGNFDVFASHGITDAPAVDVIARGFGTLVSGSLYEDMSNYFRVPVGQYILDITPAGDHSISLASYLLDLPSLYYQFGFIMASGFFDPAANQNGAAFGLYVVLVNGNVIPLPLAAAQDLANQSLNGPSPYDADPAGKSAGIAALPEGFELSQNYPNPFNPSTNISFSLPASEVVSLSVYDITGHEVSRMDLGAMSAGLHQVSFNASNLPTGRYFYRVQAGSKIAVKSMMLVK